MGRRRWENFRGRRAISLIPPPANGPMGPFAWAAAAVGRPRNFSLGPSRARKNPTQKIEKKGVSVRIEFVIARIDIFGPWRHWYLNFVHFWSYVKKSSEYFLGIGAFELVFGAVESVRVHFRICKKVYFGSFTQIPAEKERGFDPIMPFQARF
jgi:hypothetical protein